VLEVTAYQKAQQQPEKYLHREIRRAGENQSRYSHRIALAEQSQNVEGCGDDPWSEERYPIATNELVDGKPRQ
jgi:hypothetical protein